MPKLTEVKCVVNTYLGLGIEIAVANSFVCETNFLGLMRS